eukprot:1851509-Lingulodinium_polyedra.AAC.1
MRSAPGRAPTAGGVPLHGGVAPQPVGFPAVPARLAQGLIWWAGRRPGRGPRPLAIGGAEAGG